MVKVLRRRQSARIKAPQNPDGSHYEARRPRYQPKANAGAGTIRGDIFARMRRPANLRMPSSSAEAAVFINPRTAATARVHQYGLRNNVEWCQSKSPTVRYARRELLGFLKENVQTLDALLELPIVLP